MKILKHLKIILIHRSKTMMSLKEILKGSIQRKILRSMMVVVVKKTEKKIIYTTSCLPKELQAIQTRITMTLSNFNPWKRQIHLYSVKKLVFPNRICNRLMRCLSHANRHWRVRRMPIKCFWTIKKVRTNNKNKNKLNNKNNQRLINKKIHLIRWLQGNK